MRINVYAEELPEGPAFLFVERVKKTADTGRTYFGARIYLKSSEALHHPPADDDRSAITFWGPRAEVAKLLVEAAGAMIEPDTRTTPSFILDTLEAIDAYLPMLGESR